MKSQIFLFIALSFVCHSCVETAESIDSFLHFEGNEIHYKVDGAGQEVIFIHGGYLDLDM